MRGISQKSIHMYIVYPGRNSELPYSQKVLLDTNFAQLVYPYITEIFHRINFHRCGNDYHRFYVIIYMGQKFEGYKFLP